MTIIYILVSFRFYVFPPKYILREIFLLWHGEKMQRWYTLRKITDGINLFVACLRQISLTLTILEVSLPTTECWFV